MRLRYGAGSPFFDIRLPCGGALEIALFPRPDPAVLADVIARRAMRDRIALRFHPDGRIRVQDSQPTGWQDADARTAAYETRLTAYSAENSRLSAEEAADHGRCHQGVQTV